MKIIVKVSLALIMGTLFVPVITLLPERSDSLYFVFPLLAVMLGPLALSVSVLKRLLV